MQEGDGAVDGPGDGWVRVVLDSRQAPKHPEGAHREPGGRDAPGAAQPAGGWGGGRGGGLLWAAGQGRGVERKIQEGEKEGKSTK